MKHLKIFKILALIFVPLISLDAMPSEIGPEISLYNIGKGHLVYNYYNGSNHYLSTDFASELITDDYPQRSNWKIVYNENGSVSFMNEYQNLCMEWNDTNWPVKQRTCKTTNKRQQFSLKLTNTGALLIKYEDECLNTNNDKKRVYSSRCEANNLYYLWSIIAPLKGSST